jgi:hypothetical protein
VRQITGYPMRREVVHCMSPIGSAIGHPQIDPLWMTQPLPKPEMRVLATLSRPPPVMTMFLPFG